MGRRLLIFPPNRARHDGQPRTVRKGTAKPERLTARTRSRPRCVTTRSRRSPSGRHGDPALPAIAGSRKDSGRAGNRGVVLPLAAEMAPLVGGNRHAAEVDPRQTAPGSFRPLQHRDVLKARLREALPEDLPAVRDALGVALDEGLVTRDFGDDCAPSGSEDAEYLSGEPLHVHGLDEMGYAV